MRDRAKLLLSVLLVGCSSNVEEDPGYGWFSWISYTPMFSAFDGVHDYAVTPSVPGASEESKDADPLLASSINWEIDGAFLKREEFPDLHAAIKLTTKRAGQTRVGVTLKTLSGNRFHSEATLTISSAKASEWDAGEARYNNDMMITWMRPMMAAAGEGTCGLPVTIELPKSSACGNCHAATSMFTIEHTPTQTAGYSNEQLINIFTTGAKPAGGTFNSPFLRSAPMPDCIYAAFHTWEMTDEEKIGVVWKLRSLPPKVQEEIPR